MSAQTLLNEQRKTEETKQGKKKSEDRESQERGNKNNPTNVLTVTDDEIGEVIDSISSDTALGILDSLHESPKVSTELAEELGTTTQNVRYHLNKLEGTGLVEVSDTCYSEKGREMSVYQPSDSPVMILFGTEK